MRVFFRFLILFFLPVMGRASTDPTTDSLPVLEAGYIQEFTTEADFSRFCFTEAFFDADGRLFLNTCGAEKTMYSLSLMQFDGYKFIPFNFDLLDIPPASEVCLFGFDESENLNGYYYWKGNDAFFSYNIDSSKVDVMYFRDHFPEGSLIRSAYQLDGGDWLFFVNSNDTLQIYQKTGEKTTLKTEIPLALPPRVSERSEPRPVEQYGDEIWFMDDRLPVVRWNMKTGKWKAYDTDDFDFNFRLDPYYLHRWWALTKPSLIEFGGDIILCFPAYEKAPFFKLDRQSERFMPVTGLPAIEKTKALFKDEAGNLIYLFGNQNRKHYGILEDSLGRRFDISGIFGEKNQVNAIVGRNFKSQALVCSIQGLYSVTIKQSNAIRGYGKGSSFRAMGQLSDGRVAASRSLDNWVIIDDERQQQSLFVARECGTDPFTSVYRRKLEVLEGDRILTYHKDKFYVYDQKNGICEEIEHIPIHNFTLINKDTIAYWSEIEQDLGFFDLKNKKPIPYFENGKPFSLNSFVQELHPSRDGQLWIVTTKGLWKVDYRNGKSIQIGIDPSFKDFRFLTMHEKQDGKLWLGTFVSGLHIYDPKTGILEVVDQEKGLVNNTVVSILEDDEGVFWVSTYKGISLVSAEGEVITNIGENEGLQGTEFNRFSYLKGKSGKLFLGTTEGLNVIDPELLKKHLATEKELQVYLTEMAYFDRKRKTEEVITKFTSFKKSVSLPAEERYLRLKLGMSSYVNTHKNRYAYKLENTDSKKQETWVLMGDRYDLNFNNLEPGDYRLWVKGCDYKGNWSDQFHLLDIHVGQFFYKQTWFFALVFGAVFLIVFTWIRRLSSEKRRLETEVARRTKQIKKDKEFIEQQAQELRQLDEMKSRFFTNISHELRTPLTLITAPVQHLLKTKGGTLGQTVQKSLQLILKNGQNLLHLVEELLDLSRLEADRIQLEETPVRLHEFCRKLFGVFESRAAIKGISYTFSGLVDEEQWFWIDKNRFEKIINNLLSNALKFTSDRGMVHLWVRHDAGQVEVKVKDSGRGIPEEDQPFVFDRYFQTKSNKVSTEGGTGIGLALSKELAKLMKGDLVVESVWGQGSEFTLTFPVRLAEPQDNIQLDEPYVHTEQEVVLPVKSTGGNSRPKIMIVEDNPDMQQMVHAILSENYDCIITNNGAEAWQILSNGSQTDIDLILSDVMMPEMDGYELLEKIKQHAEWKKHPVIMLTARAREEDKLKALRLGVDDYLLKPFSPDELITRAENLIANYQQRKSLVQQTPAPVTVEFEVVESASQLWLEELEKAAKVALDKKIDLSAAYLAGEMALSERQLLRKIKTLTGLTSKQYIQEVRLQKARHLLENRTYSTLSEVAYACGFNTPGYFSKVFEKQYGKKPGEYLQL